MKCLAPRSSRSWAHCSGLVKLRFLHSSVLFPSWGRNGGGQGCALLGKLQLLPLFPTSIHGLLTRGDVN